MAWYQQTQGQELKFLIQHYEKSEREKGNLPSRFSVQQFDDYHSEMNVSALELEDSAMYYCASSDRVDSPLYFAAGTRLTVTGMGVPFLTGGVMPVLDQHGLGKELGYKIRQSHPFPFRTLYSSTSPKPGSLLFSGFVFSFWSRKALLRSFVFLLLFLFFGLLSSVPSELMHYFAFSL